ncbi:hypothetical protein V6N11_082857 [Hibiscus sabdariffa]|uniref:6-phosphogluconate dehydrogenase NADP-binding domain-containing protein n=1 Tax=Hibiscus sabdariffa TaxID=183260 RepID=A0ABR2QK49_9ROSI
MSRVSRLIKNVGFIGLGNMGSRMTNNLLKAGYKLPGNGTSAYHPSISISEKLIDLNNVPGSNITTRKGKQAAKTCGIKGTCSNSLLLGNLG